MGYTEQYEKWINSPKVDDKTKTELKGIAGDETEKELRFNAMLDFGTAGQRGIMRAGINGMNVYTVRYTTQGLADLINECGEDKSGGVTISYDSRNNSALFAEEVACVLAANDIKVNLFDELRPTPELSFALRETGSIAGVNITASHNPKEYNGYKVYWSDGAQLPPEHAAQISSKLGEIDIFDDVKTMPIDEAKEKGLVRMLGSEMDEKYLAEVLKQANAKDAVAKVADDFQIIFTPLHGTGYKLVPEALRRLGMKKVLTVAEQMVIDGNFPTVESPNPENKEAFTTAIEMAKENGIDLIVGTDPDGDRCGTVVKNGDEYETMSGNQMGALLLDYLIQVKKEKGELKDNSFACKSIVSTTMANAICEENGIKLYETLTGFKYIGEKIKELDDTGKETFLFGFEESYGYLSGTYTRDKDAIVAAMLIAEMAAWYKLNRNMNLYEAMQELYKKYGYFDEIVTSVTIAGLDGPKKIASITENLRKDPPKEFCGLKVVRARDYQTGEITITADGSKIPTGLPQSNVLFYDLEGGNSLIVRPSGTEPKIKLYVMAKSDTAEGATKTAEDLTAEGKKLLD